MKHLFLTLAVILIGLSACNKGEEPQPVQTPAHLEGYTKIGYALFILDGDPDLRIVYHSYPEERIRRIGIYYPDTLIKVQEIWNEGDKYWYKNLAGEWWGWEDERSIHGK